MGTNSQIEKALKMSRRGREVLLLLLLMHVKFLHHCCMSNCLSQVQQKALLLEPDAFDFFLLQYSCTPAHPRRRCLRSYRAFLWTRLHSTPSETTWQGHHELPSDVA